ncbi:MAG: dicarboxylate/amino acid:cation symporter [Opitutaceae bacterium]|nr:dicarboxylate/amino acid:cation symporter [Opitutaceae bacterium]
MSTSDRTATRILVGLLVGVGLGLVLRGVGTLVPDTADGISAVVRHVFEPLGQVFLRLLFFVVVPLVFCSLTLGLAQLGRLDRLGPLAGKTFLLFALNMAVGVALGLALMNVLQPGAGIDASVREQLVAEQAGAVKVLAGKPTASGLETLNLMSLVEMFMPRNLLGAVADFQVLPLILFALLVGAASTLLPDGKRQRWLEVLETGSELMTRIVNWALKLAPYAVAAMLASVVLKFGASFLVHLLTFVGGVLAVIALHLFGTLALVVKFATRHGVREFYRAIRVILVTAFSTSSSNATLPTTLTVTTRDLGVSPSTAGFVIPLGATMNMSGTALYEGCVVLFVAQVYGVPLDLVQQATLVLMAVLSAVAVAGIPGGSLPLIMGLLVSFGIPAEGIALVLGVDRILDMARTTLNVAADVVTACVVDGWGGKPPTAEV